jgi:hypothetical protein
MRSQLDATSSRSPSDTRPPPPCRLPPHPDDIGGAFGMGALGGGLWHTYRGLKNSPKGYKIAGTLEVGWAVVTQPAGLLSALLLGPGSETQTVCQQTQHTASQTTKSDRSNPLPCPDPPP